MERTRIRLAVDVDLDPVPGWGDNADDWRQALQFHLDKSVPHYNPVVAVGDDGEPLDHTEALRRRDAEVRAATLREAATAIRDGVLASHPNQGYRDGFARAAQIVDDCAAAEDGAQ